MSRSINRDVISKIVERLKSMHNQEIQTLLEELISEAVEKKTISIFEQYEKSPYNPLLKTASMPIDFWDAVMPYRSIIITKIQPQIRKLILAISKNKLTESHVNQLLMAVERETWNLIYQQFVKEQ